MKQASTKKSVSGIAALILLSVFAAAILSVLLTGADVYKRLSQRNTDGYDARTGIQYLSGKVRQMPDADALAVSEFGEGDCLVITEEIGNTRYETKIYCCDGWLMELFSAADSGLEPIDGNKILPAESLLVTAEDDLLKITFSDGDGNEDAAFLYLRGGKAAKK